MCSFISVTKASYCSFYWLRLFLVSCIIYTILINILDLSSHARHTGVLDPGGLETSSVDSVSTLIGDNVLVLLFVLGSLPHLNLHAASNDRNSHGGKQVVASVGVSVDTSVEDSGTVLADGAHNEGLSTRVVLDKGRHVVDNARNENQISGLGLLLELLKLNDRQLLNGDTPVEVVSPLVQLLLSLLHETLLDGVLGEGLEVPGETNLLEGPDEPLGGVVLVPDEGVSVVRGELVVEVVVALSKGDQGGKSVVSGSSSVVEGLLSNPVGKGVDTESHLLHKGVSHDTGVDKTSLPVAPAKATDEGGQNNGHEDENVNVVLVLESDNPVVVEVRNVSSALVLGVGHKQHPAKVGEPESLSGVVRVLVGVGPSVVDSVRRGPPSDGALDSSSSKQSKDDSNGQSGLVGSMGPHSVVAGGDTETGAHVIADSKRGGLPVEGDEGSGSKGRQRQRNHQNEVEPVDVLVPVGPGEGLLGNVAALVVVGALAHLNAGGVLDLVVDISAGGNGVDLREIHLVHVFHHVECVVSR